VPGRVAARFFGARCTKRLQLVLGDYVVGFGRMVCVCGKFRLEPLRTDRRGILIFDAVGKESFVCNVQSECALRASLAYLERVFANEEFGLEAKVLDDDTVAHLAPGTNTRDARTGA
jgi:hypothetical protein